MARQWPGNVRQLRHEVERAFVFCEDGILRVSDFSKAGAQARQPAISPLERGSSANQEAGPLRQALEQVENDLIANAMARFKGNKKKVAEHLGVSRSYLYKKLGVEGD
jgi:DNA-binding NtrC family response regulator